MAATPLRSLLATAIVRPRFGTASFASSSRIGLDFTRPRTATKPTTTTTTTTTTTQIPTAPPTSTQPSPSPPSPPQTSQTSQTGRPQSTPPPAARPSTPFIRPTPTTTPITPSFRPTPARPRGATEQRYEPEDALLAPVNPDEYSRLRATNRAICISHTLHVKSTRNNVHLTFTDSQGSLWGTVSGGNGKVFKGTNRSSHEAAHQAAVKTFERIVDYASKQRDIDPNNVTQIRVAFNGLAGHGREAVSQAIAGPEGADIRPMIVRVEDRTPIRIGGNRPPKRRRI